MPTVDQLKKQFLELGILTFITVFVWIGYSVYVALTQPSQTQVSKQELEPVPITIDLQLLEGLSERKGVSDTLLIDFSSGLRLEEASPSASAFLITEIPAEVVTDVDSSTSSASSTR